ncbi:DNA-processing protein DprA [Caenimonas terrae]|uniref:DNA-processing protein DprA n=1 Tax=Caenimonas terrae TaxID=696074 RepID=A0ABW0N7V8_9BURK
MEREELGSWLRLALTPGAGNAAARKLMAAFGPPCDVFSAPAAALREFAGPTLAAALAQEPAELPAQLRATLEWLDAEQPGVPRRVLNLSDVDYPQALLDTEDPPPILYVMGHVQMPWPRAIAVVGSRNPTPQGQANARQFGRSLAQAGLTVVSGLALGIDGAAHEGALEGAGPQQLATIAVVGTGLDSVYPRQHEALAGRIAQRGLIVSEYPLGTAPLPANFPRRNRIIAGLSQGTLVVEAAVRSGSLITARMAIEQGKDVFAIPGSIHSPQSRGCHELLRQGAKLVESAQDVLEELHPGVAARAETAGTAPAPATGAPARLLQALGFDPVSLDALVARTGTSAAELQALLLELELSGHVSRLPGGLFQRSAAV